jgi:hypothetical protein
MKKFLVVLIVILVLIVVIGLFLSSEYSLERSIVVGAKPAAVHKLVGDLNRWEEWMPWKEQDPTIQVELGQKTTGVGASQRWTSKDGAGSITFTASDKDKGIEYDMVFGDYTSKGSIRYEQVGKSTKVTWGMTGEIPTPVIGGYMALLMPSMIGTSFDKGLNNLKRVAEK